MALPLPGDAIGPTIIYAPHSRKASDPLFLCHTFQTHFREYSWSLLNVLPLDNAESASKRRGGVEKK